MKRFLLAVLIIGVCACNAWADFPDDWQMKCLLTVDKTKVAADQSNFPILFTVANLPATMFDADGYAPALNGGGDIRFTSDIDGTTQLPCEVVSFVTNNNPALGTAEIWVKSNVSSSTDTTLYVWWGKSGETQPAPSDTYGSENVWDTNYKMVLHMNGASATDIDDSTSNNNDVTSDNGTPDYNQTGIFSGGYSVNFDDASSEFLNIADNVVFNPITNFTIEAWYKPVNTTITDYEGIFCKYGSVDGGWILFRWDDEDLSFYTNGSGGVDECRGDPYQSTNWVFWAGGADGSANKVLYVNGVSNGTGGPINIADSNAGVRIGATYNNTTNFTADGYIDEVRYSDTYRDGNWLLTEYRSISSPSTFVTEGSPQSALTQSWGRRCALVIDHTKVSADDNDMPVLFTKDNLPSEMFDADGSYPALEGGGDIRFSSDEDGDAQLPCEVVTFSLDDASDVAEIWVPVDVSSSSDVTIYVWYNKAGETQPARDDTYGAENVWSSNYRVVYHFQDNCLDSTSQDNDGTNSNGTYTTGKFSKGINFGGDGDYVNLGTPTYNEDTQGTVQFWFNSNDALYSYTFAAEADGASALWFVPNVSAQYMTAQGALTTASYKGWNATVSQGSWNAFTWTGNGVDDWLGYNDGSAKSIAIEDAWTESCWFSTLDRTTYWIGKGRTASLYANGIVDEFRITNDVLDANWITTEYNSQSSPSTFAEAGTPETPGGGPTGYTSQVIMICN